MASCALSSEPLEAGLLSSLPIDTHYTTQTIHAVHPYGKDFAIILSNFVRNLTQSRPDLEICSGTTIPNPGFDK